MFFYGRNHSRTLGAVGGVAALTSLLLSGGALAGEAEILWDQFGIPHIYGPDVLTVVRGLGYAEMENHAETILMNVAAARGKSAKYFGPGANNANINNDITVRTEGIPDRAKLWLLTGGIDQAAIILAFTAGANEYATRHGKTIDPLFQPVLPLLPTDITAGILNTVHFHFMPNQDNLPALILAWQTGGITAANAVACSHTPACQNGAAVARIDTLSGSNGWAIAPKKSASGNAILMGNPHLPWGNNTPIPPINGLGIYQWMEANLVIGDPENPTLNASGVAIVGAPFLGIGYSDKVGWTHTNNTIQNTNLYELTLNPDGITYKFGNGVRPLLCRPDAIKVRQANDIHFTICASVHGPIIAQRVDAKGVTKLLALRVAGLEKPSMVSQYWGMIQAHNLKEFIAANSALQMPFFNVIYADRDGHTLYLFGGQQPVRPGGDWGKYSGILDGSDPSLLWTRTFSWWDLPRAIDPDLVANSNNPPWNSTFPQFDTNNPDKFFAYISPQFMDMRAQNGAILLQSKGSLTSDDVLSFKESTYMRLADRVLPDLIAAALAYPDLTAKNAANILAAWDHNADHESIGAVLFEAWWALVTSQTPPPPLPQCSSLPTVAKDNTINFYTPHPQFFNGWSASDPLNTPKGLYKPADTVPYLICAALQVQAAYGDLEVAWGDVHRIVLATHDPTFQQPPIRVSDAPQSGADDPFGPLRVLFRYPDTDMKHFFAVSGDGYVQLVEFAKDGAKAQALLGYGNSSRPGSPPLHVIDQLPFFQAKTLRPVYRTPSDVKMHPPFSREVVH
jgi:acyl-homoserine-lactone acylase